MWITLFRTYLSLEKTNILLASLMHLSFNLFKAGQTFKLTGSECSFCIDTLFLLKTPVCPAVCFTLSSGHYFRKFLISV